MAKKQSPKSLGGTVLIMVITVMSVLIIMLLATLTIVSTANQRVALRYEENQAFYTAQTAIDVFIDGLLDDRNYLADEQFNGTTFYGWGDGDEDHRHLNIGDYRQGLSLDMVLYRMWAYNDNGIFSNIFFDDHTFYNDGDFDLTTGDDRNKMYSVVSKDGGSPYDTASSPYTPGIFTFVDNNRDGIDDNKGYIGKLITTMLLPAVAAPADVDTEARMGLMADRNGDGIQEVTLTIEVESRTYAMGKYLDGNLYNPTYGVDYSKIDNDPEDPTEDYGTYFDADYDSIANVKHAIKTGDRTKDQITLKITAETTLNGVDGKAVMWCDAVPVLQPPPPPPPPPPPGGGGGGGGSSDGMNNAIQTTGNLANASGSQVSAFGGVSALEPGTVRIGDGNRITGTQFTIGSFDWYSSQETYFNAGESVVAMDKINMTNSANIKAHADGVFLFAGESFTHDSTFTVGDSTHNVSIITSDYKMNEQTSTIYGNLYATRLEHPARNYGNNNYLKVLGKTLPGGGVEGGNIYVKELVLPPGAVHEATEASPAYIDFKMLQDNNIVLCNGFKVICEGEEIDLEDYNHEGLGTGSLNTTDLPSAFDVSQYEFPASDGSKKREYTLPAALPGMESNTIKIATAQSSFSQYFKPDSFNPNSGDLIDNAGDDERIRTNDSAYANLYSSSNKYEWLKTGGDMFNDYLAGIETSIPENLNMEETADYLGAQTIDQILNNAKSGSIDVTGRNVYVKLEGSLNNYNIEVTGEGGRLIFILPENEKVNLDNTKIYQDTLALTSPMSVENGSTKAPLIDFYGGTGSEINFNNTNYVTGYFNLPTGTINNKNRGPANINYSGNDGGTSISAEGVDIVGSVLCETYNGQNQAGVVFIAKDSGRGSPYEPPTDPPEEGGGSSGGGGGGDGGDGGEGGGGASPGATPLHTYERRRYSR